MAAASSYRICSTQPVAKFVGATEGGHAGRGATVRGGWFGGGGGDWKDEAMREQREMLQRRKDPQKQAEYFKKVQDDRRNVRTHHHLHDTHNAPRHRRVWMRPLANRSSSFSTTALHAERSVPEVKLSDLPDPHVRFLKPLRDRPEREPGKADAVVYPLFPLGSNVHLPTTDAILNIFEPRYRKMYQDILLSDRQEFAVCMVDNRTGQFAEVATIFDLTNLQEVSARTDDKVKYICSHKCTRRVRIKKVLNPRNWVDKDAYLRVEVEELDGEAGGKDPVDAAAGGDGGDDDGGGVVMVGEKGAYMAEDEDGCADDKLGLCADFDRLVAEQNAENVTPRFTPNMMGVFKPEDMVYEAGSGGVSDEQFWRLAELMRVLITDRNRQVMQQANKEVEKKLMEYLGADSADAISLIGTEVQLPEWLQDEIRNTVQTCRVKMGQSQARINMDFQQLLQERNRKDRINILRRIVITERGMLSAAKKMKKKTSSEDG